MRTLILALAASSLGSAQIAERITANHLKGDVSFLASDALQGRGTPSPGLDVAAEFIASQFRAAGLEPGGDDGYFQTASFVSVTPDDQDLRLVVELGGNTITIDKAKMTVVEPAAVDLAHVPAVVASSVEGLTPDQVTGKVLFLGASPRLSPLARAAVERLRPALVVTTILDPGGAFRRRPAQLRDASQTALPSLLVWDETLREAIAAFKPDGAAPTVTAHVSAKSEPLKLKNVVGVLRGSDPVANDTCVLVTAHYDHLGTRTGPGDVIFNGANDDASGTASMIEIARAIAAETRRPKRTLVFIALFGEEAGLLGSRFYARRPIFPLAKTVGDLNLEHMGRTDVVGGPRVGVLNATGFDYTDMTATLAAAGAEFGIKVEKDEQNSDPFYARSDNQAFADAGIPAHTLSVGYIFPDYHQPGDEWPKLDYDNMAKVDRAVAMGIWRIADSPDAPKWNAASPAAERYRKAR